MNYGIEASESLVEILGVLRDARNMISDFTSEYAAYLGVDNVRVLNRIHSTIQEKHERSKRGRRKNGQHVS